MLVRALAHPILSTPTIPGSGTRRCGRALDEGAAVVVAGVVFDGEGFGFEFGGCGSASQSGFMGESVGESDCKGAGLADFKLGSAVTLKFDHPLYLVGY